MGIMILLFCHAVMAHMLYCDVSVICVYIVIIILHDCLSPLSVHREGGVRWLQERLNGALAPAVLNGWLCWNINRGEMASTQGGDYHEKRESRLENLSGTSGD